MLALFFPYGVVLQAIAILHFVRRRPDTIWLWIILLGAYQIFPRRKRIKELEGLIIDNPAVGNYEELGDLCLDDEQFTLARECFDRVIYTAMSWTLTGCSGCCWDGLVSCPI